MDMKAAFKETLELARQREYDNVSFEAENVDFEHLTDMYERMTQDDTMSEAKLGRWLGYMQGVLVANACITLEEAKAINGRYANDWTHLHKKRGSRYKVVGMARAQCSTIPINDGDMLTLYRGEDGVYSVRPPAEFADGRFERIVSNMPSYDKLE